MKENVKRYYDPIYRNIRNWKKKPEALRRNIRFQLNIIKFKPEVFKYFEDTLKSRSLCLYAIKCSYKKIFSIYDNL